MSSQPLPHTVSPALCASGAFTLLAIACLTIMVGCVIVPGLTEIAARLGVGQAAGWLVTVPSLGVVLLGPLAGWCIARLGNYRALGWGLFAYGLLGAGGVLLEGAPLIFADRFLLGGATAVVMAAGTGLLSHFYHGPARLAMMARQGMAIELGGVIFLFIGGLLATLGWRWPFALYLVAWLLLVMLRLWVPRPPEATPVAAGHGGNARLWAVHGAALCSMISFFTGVITLPAHLHHLGLAPAQIGSFLAFVSLVAVGAAWLMPRTATRLGEHGALALAFVAYAAAHALFALAYAAAHALFALAGTLPLFIAGGVLMGLGFGLSVPLANHLVVERSPAATRGTQLARLSMAIFSGQFLASFMAFMPTQGGGAFWLAALLALAAAAILPWRIRG